MATFIQDFMNYLSGISGYVHIILAAVLIIIGVAFMLPFEATKKYAKSMLPWALLGAGIILGAVSFATEYVNSFTFTQ